MRMIDAIGYLAAGLVLATFCMRSIKKLRLVGLASNLAFIVYGYLDNLMPVLVLHALLLPVNACRFLRPTSVVPRADDAVWYQLYLQEPGARARKSRRPRHHINAVSKRERVRSAMLGNLGLAGPTRIRCSR